MTLRSRIAIAVGLIVAAGIASAGLISYQSSRTALQNEVDQFLRARSQRFTRGGFPLDRTTLPSVGANGQPLRFAELDATTQVLDNNGAVVVALNGEPHLPIDAGDIALAKATGRARLRDVTVGNQHYRMLTASISTGGAVQIARNLSEVNAVLNRLREGVLLMIGFGTALAALAGLVVGRRTARPIEHLRDAAEQVTASGVVTEPIVLATGGGNEVGQLALAFNSMLAALARAREQQTRLVADASHELRTPLTAVRTNIEFLERAPGLDEAERQHLLAQTRTELEELTELVTEMVELATDTRTVEPVVEVDLPELAGEVAERFRRRYGRPVQVALRKPGRVQAQRGLLDRAIANLVDNAMKFSDGSEGVDITVDGTAIEVADRGPGIAPEDRENVFARFYRAAGARTRPGSGLGLSIVAQIAEANDATVTLDPRPGGGTVARFQLPSDR